MAIKKTENKVENKVETKVESKPTTVETKVDLMQKTRETKSTDFCWAVSDEKVKVPTKRESDAGYDIYAFFDEDYMVINPNSYTIFPTGLYYAIPDDMWMDFRERSSTIKYNLSRRGGVIDGTYRGELMVALSNLNTFPIVIAKNTISEEEIKEQVSQNCKIYPYEKAIIQGILMKKEPAQFTIIPLEELKKMTTIRGEGGFGSTGK